MSSLLTHIFIPLFILLIFSDQLKLSKKLIIVMSFFAIFPDIDIFSFHRADLHNVFILLIPIGIYVFWKDIRFSGIMAYYMISHIILDIFNGGVHLLYPIYDKVLIIIVGLLYDNNTITFVYKIFMGDKLSVEILQSPMVSSENSATIILILIMFIVTIVNKHKNFK